MPKTLFKLNYGNFKNITVLMISMFLVSCANVNFAQWHFPYMMDVQQGNYIEQKQFEQIKLGMTKQQTQLILGSPLTQYMFDQNRWDFIYQKHNNNKVANTYSITMYFNEKSILNKITKTGELFTN